MSLRIPLANQPMSPLKGGGTTMLSHMEGSTNPKLTRSLVSRTFLGFNFIGSCD